MAQFDLTLVFSNTNANDFYSECIEGELIFDDFLPEKLEKQLEQVTSDWKTGSSTVRETRFVQRLLNEVCLDHKSLGSGLHS